MTGVVSIVVLRAACLATEASMLALDSDHPRRFGATAGRVLREAMELHAAGASAADLRTLMALSGCSFERTRPAREGSRPARAA